MVDTKLDKDGMIAMQVGRFCQFLDNTLTAGAGAAEVLFFLKSRKFAQALAAADSFNEYMDKFIEFDDTGLISQMSAEIRAVLTEQIKSEASSVLDEEELKDFLRACEYHESNDNKEVN